MYVRVLEYFDWMLVYACDITVNVAVFLGRTFNRDDENEI